MMRSGAPLQPRVNTKQFLPDVIPATVLVKVNYDNGHFTEDREVIFVNFADQYAFVMWQCGHPDFQLKN